MTEWTLVLLVIILELAVCWIFSSVLYFSQYLFNGNHMFCEDIKKWY